MSAPDCLHHVLRRDDVAERLRHLAALLVEHEAVRQHHVERRAAAGAAAFQQRGMKPAAVLVGAFEIHHRVAAAVGLRLMPARLGKCSGSSSTKACVEPESNQTSRCRRPSSSPRWRASRGSARARRPAYQASAPSCSKASAMRLLTASSCRMSTEPSAFSLHEHRDRHAPGALARDHPVGPALDHAVDAVLARGRHPARRLDRAQRAMSRSVPLATRRLRSACPSR